MVYTLQAIPRANSIVEYDKEDIDEATEVSWMPSVRECLDSGELA